MSIVLVESQSLGEGWLRVSRAILEGGAPATYDGQRTRELALLTLTVAQPSPDDEVIARLGDPRWLAWMHHSASRASWARRADRSSCTASPHTSTSPSGR